MYYFVPRQTGVVELVRDARLEYAFDGTPESTLVSGERGPDGLSGLVLTQQPVVPRVTWRKRAPGPQTPFGVWMGWNPSDPPGPQTLRRRGIGTADWPTVALADGQRWAIPLALPCTARDSERSTQLPGRAIAIDRTGAPHPPRFAPDPQFDDLLFALSRVTERPVTEAELIELAAGLLGVAYRVSLAEVLALGLLTQTNAKAIVWTALDFDERTASAAAEMDREAFAHMTRLIAADVGVSEDVAARTAAALVRRATATDAGAAEAAAG